MSSHFQVWSRMTHELGLKIWIVTLCKLCSFTAKTAPNFLCNNTYKVRSLSGPPERAASLYKRGRKPDGPTGHEAF